MRQLKAAEVGLCRPPAEGTAAPRGPTHFSETNQGQLWYFITVKLSFVHLPGLYSFSLTLVRIVQVMTPNKIATIFAPKIALYPLPNILTAQIGVL